MILLKTKKRNIEITDRYIDGKNRTKYYKYICNNCGWKNGYMSEYSITNGANCSCCKNRTVVEGINDIPTTSPWMIQYFQGGYDEARLYSNQSNKTIYPICPYCKRIKNKPVHIENIFKWKSIGCICGDNISFPEKYMFSFLSQLNICFEYQYIIKNESNKRYDFYLPLYNTIIETHGAQHYKYSDSGWFSDKKFREIQSNDKYKMEIALKNNISNYIVIDCQKSEGKYIKNSILQSNLKNIINFNEKDVDWEKCEYDACKNLVFEVCNEYNSNNRILIKDLANKFHISRQTTRKYLKKGSELGLCSYNIQDIRENGRKSKKYKKIRCINKNMIFDSAADAARYINNELHESGARNGISRVLNKKQLHYKGYFFEYV